jgi:hypothetical protein
MLPISRARLRLHDNLCVPGAHGRASMDTVAPITGVRLARASRFAGLPSVSGFQGLGHRGLDPDFDLACHLEISALAQALRSPHPPELSSARVPGAEAAASVPPTSRAHPRLDDVHRCARPGARWFAHESALAVGHDLWRAPGAHLPICRAFRPRQVS